VESASQLDWWITNFFAAPNPRQRGRGADHKLSNALRRQYTANLKSTKSVRVVDWLKGAMDLHYENRSPNPLWNDGKALRVMWEEVLKRDLPSDDRHENTVPRSMKIREASSLHATYTVPASLKDPYKSRDEPTQPPVPAPPKRPRKRSGDDGVPYPTPQPSKRSRTGPQTRSISVTGCAQSREGESSTTGVGPTTVSLGASDILPSGGGMHTSLRPVL